MTEAIRNIGTKNVGAFSKLKLSQKTLFENSKGVRQMAHLGDSR